MLRVAAAVCLILLTAAPALADKRIFIVANSADDYGVDRCLAGGLACGKAIAQAYCRAREFNIALSFRKVDRDDITGAIPASDTTCTGNSCDNFVAIECGR